MKPEEFHLILSQAARRARRIRPSWLDTQDLTQAAQLALLEAERAGKFEDKPFVDQRHLVNRTRLRAWGAMVDAIRTAYGGRSKHNPRGAPLSFNDSSNSVDHTPIAADDPERTLQLKRAVERFARKGNSHQHEAVTLRAAGFSLLEIAAIMGVSESRVSQLIKEAREIMSVWGDL